MGLRQMLREKPRVVIVIAGVMTIAAFAFGVMSLRGGGRTATPNASREQQFFSVDDGKTWFADDADKIPPFKVGENTAYRAKVFRCKNGTEFVSHLERHSPGDKRRLEQTAQGGGPLDYAAAANAMEVKKPGQAEWVKLTPENAARYSAILQPKCPDGSGDVEVVLPR